jgi:hypothetical protein
MLNAGTLVRDPAGRITFRDGVLVRREPNETIIQAAARRNGMQSHFFALNDVSEYYQSDAEPDEEDSEVEVLAAEKQPKIITKARKEVFDGVLVPSRKDKENVRPGPAGKVAGAQPSSTPN